MENATAPGSSPTSLHLQGRAFDLRMPKSPESLYRFVEAVIVVARGRPVELELVAGPSDRHIHLGLYSDGGHPPKLELSLD